MSNLMTSNLEGRLRIRRTVSRNNDGIFPQVEDLKGSRQGIPPSLTRDIPNSDMKEIFAFVLDTPHNRAFYLLGAKKADEVAVHDGKGWAALSAGSLEPLFAPAAGGTPAKAPKEEEAVLKVRGDGTRTLGDLGEAPKAGGPGGPNEEGGDKVDDDDAPVLNSAADVAKLEAAQQLEVVNAADCPVALLKEVAAGRTTGIKAAVAKAARDRVKALPPEVPTPPTGEEK